VSAYLVSRRHIDFVVAAILSSELVPEAYAVGPDTLGRSLWESCHDSVAYRYPDDTDEQLPGYRYDAAEAHAYTYTPITLPDLTTRDGVTFTHNALGGYRYQSCEHPEWAGGYVDDWTKRVRDALGEWLGIGPEGRTAHGEGWDIRPDYDPAVAQLAASLRGSASAGSAGSVR
jgi:hypothetical protein